MTEPSLTNPIVSTKQLLPDGLWGYRKAIGTFITAVVALVSNAWADGDISAAEWRTIALGAVTAALAAYALPNAVKPTPPAPVEPPDPEDVQPLAGRHEAPTVKPAGELGWGIAQTPPGPGTD